MENKKRKLSGLILTGSALAGFANNAATTTSAGFSDFLKNKVSNFKDVTTNFGNKLSHTVTRTSAKLIDFLNSKIDKNKDVITRVGGTLNNIVTKSITSVSLDKAALSGGSAREPVLTKYSVDGKHNKYNNFNETTNGESKHENNLNSTNTKGKQLNEKLNYYTDSIKERSASKSISNIDVLIKNNDEFDKTMEKRLLRIIRDDLSEEEAGIFSKFLANLRQNGIKIFSKLIKKSEKVTDSIWNLIGDCDKSAENFGLLINEVNGSENSLKKLKEIIENTSCIEHDNREGEKISENTLAILLKQKSFDQTAAKKFSILFNSEKFDIEYMYYFAKLINELCTDLSIDARDTKANNFVTLMKSKNFEKKNIFKKFHDIIKMIYDWVPKTIEDKRYGDCLRGLSDGLLSSKQFDEKTAEGLATLLSDKNFDNNAFLSLLAEGAFRNRAADILAQLFKNENIAQNFALLIKDKNFDACAFTSIVSNKAITEETYAHVADNLAKLLINENLDISKFASMMLANEFSEEKFINTLAKLDFKADDFITENKLQTKELEKVVNIKDKNLSVEAKEVEDKVENSTNEANKLKNSIKSNSENHEITKNNIINNINDNGSNAKALEETKVLEQGTKTLDQELINDKYKEQAFKNYENIINKLKNLGAKESLAHTYFLNNNFFEILKYELYDEESINNFALLLKDMDLAIIYLINNIKKENIRNVSKFFFSKLTEKMNKFFNSFLLAREDAFTALPKLFNSKSFDVDKFANFVESFGSNNNPNYENLNKLIIELGEHAQENFTKLINNIDNDSIGGFEILINEVPTDTLVKLFNASNFENHINKIIEKFKEGDLEFAAFLQDNEFNEKNFEKFLYKIVNQE